MKMKGKASLLNSLDQKLGETSGLQHMVWRSRGAMSWWTPSKVGHGEMQATVCTQAVVSFPSSQASPVLLGIGLGLESWARS